MTSQIFRIVSTLYIGITFSTVVHAQPAGTSVSPVGMWRTVSDVDGKPGALIEIGEHNDVLVGVVKRSLAPDDPGNRVCEKCEGDRPGQPIVGMQIPWGLRPDGKEWGGGSTLDPHIGKIYRAKMRLTNNVQSLVVRGFIGVSLLGRSQT